MYSVPKALDMGSKNSHVMESSLSRLFHQYSGLNYTGLVEVHQDRVQERQGRRVGVPEREGRRSDE